MMRACVGLDRGLSRVSISLSLCCRFYLTGIYTGFGRRLSQVSTSRSVACRFLLVRDWVGDLN